MPVQVNIADCSRMLANLYQQKRELKERTGRGKVGSAERAAMARLDEKISDLQRLIEYHKRR